jgi:D-xylono/L-arabinono-1,4-lactonase
VSSGTPAIVADRACLCGENPLWHPLERRLYWVDIYRGLLFRFDPAAGTHEQAYRREGQIGGFTIQADGSLLLFMDRGAIGVLRGDVLTPIVESVPGEENGRFNDVIADPEGRVFCGTMPADGHLGSLYRLDRDGRLTKLVEGLSCSNGMGFTPDLAGMYHVDSMVRTVSLFDYDRATGSLSNRRQFARLPESLGVPDGLTVDAKGFPWVAVWGGGCLIRFTPDGREERRVYFTAKQVSSIAFGGEDYRDAYVTTAGADKRGELGPGSGALFRLRPGVKGVPEHPSRVGI